MYHPDAPRFRLRDLRARPPATPWWLEDDIWIPPGDRALYAAGKTGLIVVSRALVDKGARTALLPEYLPPGVVVAVRQAGLEVSFYPIRADLTIGMEGLRSQVREREPDVLLVAHYFGFVDEGFDEAVSLARAAGGVVIEDCARGLFGRDGSGRLLGSTGVAAVFSPHKTLPIPHGGVVVAREIDLPPPRRAVSEGPALLRGLRVSLFRAVGVPPPGRRCRRLAGGITHDPLPGWRRGPDRLGGAVWPPAAPGLVSRSGLASADPAAVQATRRRHYQALRGPLTGVSGVSVLTPPAPMDGAPHGVVLSFDGGRPVRDAVADRLSRRGLPNEVFRWPLTVDGRNQADFPGARALRERLLVLPCNQQLPAHVLGPMVGCVLDVVSDAEGASISVPTV